MAVKPHPPKIAKTAPIQTRVPSRGILGDGIAVAYQAPVPPLGRVLRDRRSHLVRLEVPHELVDPLALLGEHKEAGVGRVTVEGPPRWFTLRVAAVPYEGEQRGKL